MADANKITIEVVDGGSKGGTSSSATSSSSTPPPLPKAKKKGGKDDERDGPPSHLETAMQKLGFGGLFDDAIKAKSFLDLSRVAKASGGEVSPDIKAAGVAGIIGLVMQGIQQVTTSMQGLAKATEKVSAGLAGLAENQFPTGSDAGNMLAELESSIPIVGELLAAQTKAQQAIANLPEKISDGFLRRAKQISGFSADIAGSEARASARSMMGDIKEARELGPSMSRMVDAQSRLENELREMLLPIKKFVVEVLADRLELLANGARAVANLPTIIQTIADHSVRALIEAAKPWPTDARKIITDELPKKLKEIMKQEEPKDLFDEFFASVDAANKGGGFAG